MTLQNKKLHRLPCSTDQQHLPKEGFCVFNAFLCRLLVCLGHCPLCKIPSFLFFFLEDSQQVISSHNGFLIDFKQLNIKLPAVNKFLELLICFPMLLWGRYFNSLLDQVCLCTVKDGVITMRNNGAEICLRFFYLKSFCLHNWLCAYSINYLRKFYLVFCPINK